MRKIVIIPLLLVLAMLPVLILSESRMLLFTAKLLVFLSIAVSAITVLSTRLIGAEKTRSLFANTLIIGIATFVGLVLAEQMVRFVYKDITTTGDNTSYFAIRWKNSIITEMNQNGFREKEIPAKKEDVYRIAVIGDSFAYGQGIDKGDRFTAILENKLNDNGGNHEVLNFGRPGAETIDHIEFLDIVLEHDPDFILLQWFTNDVEGRDKSGRTRPYRMIPSDFLSQWLHRNSALYYLINNQWSLLQTGVGMVESYTDSMIRRFSDPESSDSVRARLEMEMFITKARDNNLPVGIVMFPRLVDVSGDKKNYPFDFLLYRVINTCEQHGIDCLDLRPVFASVSPVSRLWVNKLDAHPSAFANRLAADAILDKFGGYWQ